jgi:amino acid permease
MKQCSDWQIWITINSTYPLLLSTQILSMIFIAVLAKRNNWKINKWFVVALVMYVVFTVLYATVFNPNSLSTVHFQNMWIQRLPTILLLTAIPTGFKHAESQAN